MKSMTTTLFVLLTLPSLLLAQDTSVSMDHWVSALAGYTKDVRFDQQDMDKFLQNWTEASNLDKWSNADETPEDITDIESIEKDPEYTQWAAGKGLDPREFLQKSLRIMALHMRTSFPAQAERMRAGMNSEAMLEGYPEDLKPQAREQVQELVRAGLANLEAMEKSIQRLPEPTAAERSLLEAHQDQLTALLEADDEEDEATEW